MVMRCNELMMVRVLRLVTEKTWTKRMSFSLFCPLQVLLIERPSGDKLAAWVTQTSQSTVLLNFRDLFEGLALKHKVNRAQNMILIDSDSISFL